MNRYFIFILMILIMSGCRHGESTNTRRDRARSGDTIVSNKRGGQVTNTGSSSNKSSVSGAVLTGEQIFEKYNSAVFYILTADNGGCYQGSGFFVSSDGLAVSNYHVFQGTYLGYEELRLTDGSKLKIDKVIAKSEKYDFIVFKVKNNGRKFNYIPLSTHKNKIGAKVYAIGSPKGLMNTFSSGEISQFRDHYIQISVPIDHGSSGGALINEYGEVIGITSAGRDDSNANLNFAEDINNLRQYIK